MNPIERFAAALEAEGNAEKQQQREEAKLNKFEPITITIADQMELARIHQLAASWKSKPHVFVRQHVRVWSREAWIERRAELEAARS
jgi:hypothetical protein